MPILCLSAPRDPNDSGSRARPVFCFSVVVFSVQGGPPCPPGRHCHAPSARVYPACSVTLNQIPV